MTFTPLTVTILATSAFAIILLFVLPGRQRLAFYTPERRKRFNERFRERLYAAGIFDQTPSFLFILLLAVSFLLGLFLSILLSSIFAIALGPVIVYALFRFYISRREQVFLEKATDELVPFLNRISTAVIAGQPAQRAYLDAVESSRYLKEPLEDSAARIAAGEKFSQALLGTLPYLPLRMWAVFVRQLELYEDVGGDLSSAIERSVSQINAMLQLQNEARSDYAIQKKQQSLILLIISGAMLLLFLLDSGRIISAFTSVIGIIGFIIGGSLIAFGVWFLNKQLRDVERKLSF
jgi:Flp pilus assembly protein TadB